ncbi:MAG: histidine kinase [Anaerolineae bacterium]|nr:histidine kinase [Anaerolineae bacterium]
MSRRLRWLRSLQIQLILWTILPVMTLVIGLALTGVYSHEQAMLDFVTERDQLLANAIAERLRDGLAYGAIAPDGQGVGEWLPAGAADLPGSIIVVSDEGTVLARSDDGAMGNIASEPGMAHVLSQQTSTFVIEDPVHGALVLSSVAVQPIGWRVIVRAQASELLGPILRLSSLGPIAAVIATGLALLILAFGWRTIAHPLQQLAKAADEVSWGNHEAIHQEISGVVELEHLHEALTGMVERLEGYQAGVIDYLDAVTKGQEAERARLARELHDGPVQSLIVLSQRAEMANHRIERGDLDKAREMLDQLRASEIDIVNDLRRMIGALRPIYLEDLGFVPALEMLVHSADARTPADVRLLKGNTLRRLCTEVELAAYRITQEGLTNAIQHAYAGHITVSIQCDDEGLDLVIADDGVGFTPETRLDRYATSGHFGLMGLQERARQLAGTMHVRSVPGEGTSLEIRLPDQRGLEEYPV